MSRKRLPLSGMIGFKIRERESFLPREKDTYSAHRDKLVEVLTQGNSFTGVYRGIVEATGELVLCPFVVSENIVREGQNKVVYRVEKQRPAFINNQISAMLPIDEDYVRQRIENSQNEAYKRRILTEDEKK